MATLKCSYELHGYVGTVFAMTSSLHNSIHPPVMEINPPKMACGCPWGGVLKTKKLQTLATLLPYRTHLSMYRCIYWVTPQSVQLNNATTTINSDISKIPPKIIFKKSSHLSCMAMDWIDMDWHFCSQRHVSKILATAFGQTCPTLVIPPTSGLQDSDEKLF